MTLLDRLRDIIEELPKTSEKLSATALFRQRSRRAITSSRRPARSSSVRASGSNSTGFTRRFRA